MEKRRLGRTGHQSTVVTFGAYSVGYLDQDEADQVIQMVLDHGVNRPTKSFRWCSITA